MNMSAYSWNIMETLGPGSTCRDEVARASKSTQDRMRSGYS